MSEEILTIEEAAGHLKVTPEIVGGLLENGDLPGRRIGGEWRTTTRALLGYVDGQSAQASCCIPVAADGSTTGAACCQPNDTGCC